MQQKSNIIIYTTEDGLTKIETTFDEDTVWLSIDQMAELFQRDKSTISRHIKISSEGELVRESVVANFATTAADGKKEFMGLTTFVGNQPTLKEAVVAENYLSEKELRAMGQLVSGYLDFAERQAEREQAMTIYINFKDFVGLGKIETEPLLAEMPAYAKRYQILLDGNSGSAALDACIDRLNRLETMVIRPYLLEVLRLYNENKLTLAQVTEIFLTTENYLFRRTMCDLPTNALNKIFLMLHREIIRYDGTEDNYVEKLKYALLSKKERARFPDDEEFKAAFEERQVYLMNSKNKIYILERFENFGTSEDKDVYRHCNDGACSIEHIMPQHLTPVWQKELGDDYEQIHEQWLHRMANLTPTAYNSKYSNSSFAEPFKISLRNLRIAL